MNLDKAIKSRHSVKKFLKKKPDWRAIIEAIEAARYAPMAGGNFSLKFVLVDDKTKIAKIAKSCQQDFIAQAHYVVVACSKSRRTLNAYGDEMGAVYARQQAGAAIENFLLKIQDLGLATCWVGYFVEDQVKKHLSIPDDAEVEAIFPIGFEYEKPKTRKAPTEMDNILYFNEFGEKRMKPLRKFDA